MPQEIAMNWTASVRPRGQKAGFNPNWHEVIFYQKNSNSFGGEN